MTVMEFPPARLDWDYKQLAARSAAEMQRRGYYNGDLGSDRNNPDNCRVCALGAMNAAITGNPFNSGFNALESNDEYSLLHADSEHPLFAEACKIAKVFYFEQWQPSGLPNGCGPEYVYRYSDSHYQTEIVNLFGFIEQGEYDEKLAAQEE